MIAHSGGGFQKLFPISSQKKTYASSGSLNFISSIDLIQSLYPIHLIASLKAHRTNELADLQLEVNLDLVPKNIDSAADYVVQYIRFQQTTHKQPS